MSDITAALPRGAAGIGRAKALTAAVVAVAVIALGVSGDPYYLHIGVLTGLSLVLAVSIRPLLLAGEASFCHGTFYALGAYTVAILSVRHGVSVWLALPAGGLVAALGALLVGLPSLRTTGSYFFLMTFGFLIVAGSLFEYLQGITGGFSGISGIPAPTGIAGVGDFYWVAVGLALVSLLFFVLVERSRWGLELRALGDARELAQAAGASRLGNMLGAFVVGAFFAGVAGGVYASYLTFISPGSFSFWLSVFVLTYVMLGGSRYLAGAIVGTVILQGLPVAAKWSDAYVAIFTAAGTLAILMLAPRGIVVEFVDRIRSRRPAVRPLRVGAQTGEDDAPLIAADLVRPGEAESGSLLEVRDVAIRFGGVQALDGVSFDVRPGESLGIIGPNGAGKTTLFNVISGFTKPDSGTIRLDGQDIAGVSPHRVVGLGLTRTFQASSVFESLTAFENVLVACRADADGRLARALRPVLRERDAVRRASQVLRLFGLDSWAESEAGQMPYGARKRLGVAVAMATRPKLLCLDEPMAGLTGPEVQQMVELLEWLRSDTGVAVILVEHRLPVVMSVSDRLIALDFGRVLAEGTPAEVAGHPAVVEAYMGGEVTEVTGV